MISTNESPDSIPLSSRKFTYVQLPSWSLKIEGAWVVVVRFCVQASQDPPGRRFSSSLTGPCITRYPANNDHALGTERARPDVQGRLPRLGRLPSEAVQKTGRETYFFPLDFPHPPPACLSCATLPCPAISRLWRAGLDTSGSHLDETMRVRSEIGHGKSRIFWSEIGYPKIL